MLALFLCQVVSADKMKVVVYCLTARQSNHKIKSLSFIKLQFFKIYITLSSLLSTIRAERLTSIVTQLICLTVCCTLSCLCPENFN